MAASSNHELMVQLEKHPQLLARIKKLLSIVDAKGKDNIQLASAAEDAISAELKGMGREILENWGQIQADNSAHNTKAIKGATLHSKKSNVVFAIWTNYG